MDWSLLLLDSCPGGQEGGQEVLEEEKGDNIK